MDLEFEDLLKQHAAHQSSNFSMGSKEELCNQWISFFFRLPPAPAAGMLDTVKNHIHALIQENPDAQLSLTSKALLAKVAVEEKFLYLCYLSNQHGQDMPYIVKALLQNKMIDSSVFYKPFITFFIGVGSGAPLQMLEIIEIYIRELMRDRKILILSATYLLDAFTRSDYLTPLFFQLMQHALSAPPDKESARYLRQLIEHIETKTYRLNQPDPQNPLSTFEQQKLREPFPCIPQTILETLEQPSTSNASESRKSLLHAFHYMLLQQAIVSHSLDNVSAYYCRRIETFSTKEHVDLLRCALQELRLNRTNPTQKEPTTQVYTVLFSAQLKLAIQFFQPHIIRQLFAQADDQFSLHAEILMGDLLTPKEIERLRQLIFDCIEAFPKTLAQPQLLEVQRLGEVINIINIRWIMRIEREDPLFLNILSTPHLKKKLHEINTKKLLINCFDLHFLLILSQIRKQKAEVSSRHELSSLIPEDFSPLTYAVYLKYYLQDQLQISVLTRDSEAFFKTCLKENSEAFFKMVLSEELAAIIAAQDIQTLSTLFCWIIHRRDLEDFLTRTIAILSNEQITSFKKLLFMSVREEHKLFFTLFTSAFITKDLSLMSKLKHTFVMTNLTQWSKALASPNSSPTGRERFDLLFLAIYTISHEKAQSELEALIPEKTDDSRNAYLSNLKQRLANIPQTPFTESCLIVLNSKIPASPSQGLRENSMFKEVKAGQTVEGCLLSK